MNEKMFCGRSAEENAKMQQYFNSLPAYVQETIHQSGVTLSSVDELKKCAEHMTHAND